MQLIQSSSSSSIPIRFPGLFISDSANLANAVEVLIGHMLHGDSSVFCTILKSSAWKRWSRSHVRINSPQSLFGPQSYGRNNVVFDELFCLFQRWIDFISWKCKWNKIIIRNCRRNETFHQNSINFVRARHAQRQAHTHRRTLVRHTQLHRHSRTNIFIHSAVVEHWTTTKTHSVLDVSHSIHEQLWIRHEVEEYSEERTHTDVHALAHNSVAATEQSRSREEEEKKIYTSIDYILYFSSCSSFNIVHSSVAIQHPWISFGTST